MNREKLEEGRDESHRVELLAHVVAKRRHDFFKQGRGMDKRDSILDGEQQVLLVGNDLGSV